MSLAGNIAPQLPFLRRFARALTGSQEAGDAYVAAMLEALIEDSKCLDESLNLKIALYQMFCRMWESVSVNLAVVPPLQESGAPGWVVKAQRSLSEVPPKAREALLLMAVEGFSIEEVGEILQHEKGEVERLIDEASNAIVNQVATSVMIVEDDAMIAMDLRDIVENLGHHIAGFARTRAEAVALAAKARPGLILADIHLADDSSGIDAVNQILRSFEVPVIFITAFPERLLTGVRPEPAFLIAKPFTPQMIKAVISQALFFGTRTRAAA
jgi:CheY-like chemotaxis protein